MSVFVRSWAAALCWAAGSGLGAQTLPAAGPYPAVPPATRTYCNPIDIGYRYNFEQLNQGISYRSGADPVIVLHKGLYYLFVTISNGYWVSPDLRQWRFVTPSMWPMEDICAPAVMSVRDTLYLLQSTFSQRPILASTAPETGKLFFYNRWLPYMPDPGRYDPAFTPGPWDPAFYHDPDTDRWYLYWGSSNVYPLFGAELDKSRRLAYKDVKDVKRLFTLDPKNHGWERFGQDHRDTIRPFMEGAWMTKHNGQYYMQYGGPGTEYNVYANGTYVGPTPLGPFTYAPNNPISYRPGGFMMGAGHGNTFQDKAGNYWNTGTAWVATNWGMERRLVMYPTDFDADGLMYADTRFGDWPHYLPTAPRKKPGAEFTGWMLLSYKKPVTATSTLDTFATAAITDEKVRRFWVAAKNEPGQGVSIDLQHPCQVRAVQVNFTDYKNNIYSSFDSTVVTQYVLEHSADGKSWQTLADLSQERTDRANAYHELPAPVQARYVRYRHVHSKSRHLAIADIRVFGQGPGAAPATPKGFTARRDTDTRNAFFSWKPVQGAVGYNIRWGTAPGKLYQTYQVWADHPTTLELRALNVGVPYYAAIEAFNEAGVSALGPVLPVR